MSNEIPEGRIDHYEVITQKDEETGDILLPIPPHLLKQLDWKPGDDIQFGLDKEGQFVLSKVTKE
jgi:hypothetical protein